jgi:anti-anti-sigma factor
MSQVYKIEKKDGIAVMLLSINNLHHEDNDEIKNAFDELLKKGEKKLILDLTGTMYISSIILASLVYMQQQAKGVGGNFVMCNVGPRIMEILTMTNLDKVLSISITREDAVIAVTKG